MEFDLLKEIIAEVLNVDAAEITAETTFVDDLGADSLDVFQIIMGVEEKLEVDFITRPFVLGDILIMCTDGLSNYFNIDELLEVIESTPRTELAEQFVELAKERGGSDNITVTVLVNE